jgi:hypothetical protein
MICVVVHPFNCHDCQNISLEHFFNLHETFSPHTGCPCFHVAFRSAYGDAARKELSGSNYRDVLGAFRKVLCIIIDRSAHCRLQVVQMLVRLQVYPIHVLDPGCGLSILSRHSGRRDSLLDYSTEAALEPK